MVKTATLGNNVIEHEAVERHVKYPRLEFKTGRLMLIVPKDFQEEDKLLEKKKDWILKKALEIESVKKGAKEKYRAGSTELSMQELKELIKSLVVKYSKKINYNPNRLFFKSMKTKWGSCSKKGNLTFNTDLRFLPHYLIEYVAFHEMLHLVDKRHSDDFWRTMKGVFPKAGQMERELLEYWFFIQESKG